MSYLVFDIETKPLENMYIPPGVGEPDFSKKPEFKSRFTADAKKRADDLAQKEADWVAEQSLKAEKAHDEYVAGATLCPDLSSVCALAYYKLDVGILGEEAKRRIRIDEDEPSLLKRIASLIFSSDIVIGHNIIGFDMNYMHWRACRLGMPDLFERFHDYWQGQVSWDKRFRDTMKIAMQRPGKSTPKGWDGLDTVSRVLGFSGKEDTGDKFHLMDDEKKVEYLTNDLERTIEVAETLGLIPKQSK